MASNSAKISSDKVAKSKAPFRYRRQKSGRLVPGPLIKWKNADSIEDKKENKAGTKKSNVKVNNESVRISGLSDSPNDFSTDPSQIHVYFRNG